MDLESLRRRQRQDERSYFNERSRQIALAHVRNAFTKTKKPSLWSKLWDKVTWQSISKVAYHGGMISFFFVVFGMLIFIAELIISLSSSGK